MRLGERNTWPEDSIVSVALSRTMTGGAYLSDRY
jgi:hypothetical protein